MANCKKLFGGGICLRDLTQTAKIQRREVSGGSIGSFSAQEVFTDYADIFCLAKTVKFSAKFAGVSIESRPTHEFYTTWIPSLNSVETGNFFIKFRDKYYSIVGIENVNESNDYVILLTTERGAGAAATA